LSEKETINQISFNQSQDAVAIATNLGFKIYSLYPFDLRVRRKLSYGLRAIQMVGITNFILLVPSGEGSSDYTSDCVLLWDDKTHKVIATFKFTENV
jgi:hypothetical protein